MADYIGRNYQHGDDIRLAIETMKNTKLPIPADPSNDTSKTEQRIWEKQVDEYVKRRNYYAEKMRSLYSLIWGAM